MFFPLSLHINKAQIIAQDNKSLSNGFMTCSNPEVGHGIVSKQSSTHTTSTTEPHLVDSSSSLFPSPAFLHQLHNRQDFREDGFYTHFTIKLNHKNHKVITCQWPEELKGETNHF